MVDEYNIYQICYHCHGSKVVPDYPNSGSQSPSGTETCPVCNGEGKVVFAWTETVTE